MAGADELVISYTTSQATAGLLADGRHLANRARDECESYRDNYHTQIPTKVRRLPG